jgi:hypothetical protein
MHARRIFADKLGMSQPALTRGQSRELLTSAWRTLQDAPRVLLDGRMVDAVVQDHIGQLPAEWETFVRSASWAEVRSHSSLKRNAVSYAVLVKHSGGKGWAAHPPRLTRLPMQTPSLRSPLLLPPLWPK